MRFKAGLKVLHMVLADIRHCWVVFQLPNFVFNLGRHSYNMHHSPSKPGLNLKFFNIERFLWSLKDETSTDTAIILTMPDKLLSVCKWSTGHYQTINIVSILQTRIFIVIINDMLIEFCSRHIACIRMFLSLSFH